MGPGDCCPRSMSLWRELKEYAGARRLLEFTSGRYAAGPGPALFMSVYKE